MLRQSALADPPIRIIGTKGHNDLVAEALRRISQSNRTAQCEERSGNNSIQEELLQLTKQCRIHDQNSTAFKSTQDIRQQRFVLEPHLRIESGDEPGVAVRHESKPALNSGYRARQVLWPSLPLVPNVPC